MLPAASLLPGAAEPVVIYEAKVKVSEPLVVEPLGDKAAIFQASLTREPRRRWRIDKLANRVQYERALQAVRIVCAAAAAGPVPASGSGSQRQ